MEGVVMNANPRPLIHFLFGSRRTSVAVLFVCHCGSGETEHCEEMSFRTGFWME